MTTTLITTLLLLLPATGLPPQPPTNQDRANRSQDKELPSVGANKQEKVAFFSGIGDLPGGRNFSSATRVSSDGSVVVGFSESENGMEAFRWTRDNGIQGLGDLPGGKFYSAAAGVSANGSIVVCQGALKTGHQWAR